MRIAGAITRRFRDVAEIARLSQPVRPRKPDAGNTLVLSGWYGTETVGDQAILAGVLEVVRARHAGRVAVASLEPAVTRQTLLDIEADEDVEAISYDAARDAVGRGDVLAVAMAGGPVMGTIEPIVDLSRLHRAARKRGVPDGFLGCGVGPLGRSLRRRLIASLLRGATCISVRDEKSRTHVAELTDRGVEVSGDPALIWLAHRRTPHENGSRSVGPRTVALALRHWPLHEFARGRATVADRDRLEGELARFSELLKQKGWDRRPVAMGFVDIGGDDRRFLERLLGNDVVGGDFTSIRPTPQRVVAQMQQADVLVAMRFHACLFGLALGLPIVAIDYTLGDKIASLADAFPESISLVDPRTLDAESLLDVVEHSETGKGIEVDVAARKCREAVSSCIEQLLDGTRAEDGIRSKPSR